MTAGRRTAAPAAALAAGLCLVAAAAAASGCNALFGVDVTFVDAAADGEVAVEAGHHDARSDAGKHDARHDVTAHDARGDRATHDAHHDAETRDAHHDVTTREDAHHDAGGHDARHDVEHDAHHDAVHHDAEHDAPHHDAGHDARHHDAGHDAGHDAETDAPLCDAERGFARDPNNCGRCGHSCLGGMCVEGQCQPVLVSQTQSLTGVPNFLTVADGVVYWTQGGPGSSDNGAFSARASGSTAQVLALIPSNSFGPQEAWGVAVAEGNVYFASPFYAVLSCPTTGCVVDGGSVIGYSYYTHGGAPIYGAITGISVVLPQLYVTAIQTGNNYNNAGTVAQCNLVADGGGCYQIAQTEPGANSPAGFGAGPEAGVLWLNQGYGQDPLRGANPPPFNTGTVMSCPASGFNGCTGPLLTTLDPAANAPQYLAIDDVNLYWTELTEQVDGGVEIGNVVACPRAFCDVSQVRVIASGQLWPQGIATDGINVYWANLRAGTVSSCPVDGCPDGGPTVLASDGGAGAAPFQVALDDAGVYWTNAVEGGTVKRVAKP